MLAPSSLRSLIFSPGHANMLRFFPGGRRPCWRRPPCEALFLRQVTPTCSGFSRIAGGFVGAVLPAKPYFFARPRQHAPVFSGQSTALLAPSFLAKPYFFAGSRQHAPSFPGRSPTMLAPSSLRSLISSPGHANRRAGGRAGRPVGVASPNIARVFPTSYFFYSAST